MTTTKEQLAASEFLWKSQKVKYLQLIAGAGSGKTTVLIESIKKCSLAYCDPKKIAVITFSKKASIEMKERLENNALKVGFVGTMHAMAYSFLQQYTKKKIKIIDDHLTIYSRLLKEHSPELSYVPIEFIFQKSFQNNAKVKEIQRKYKDYKTSSDLYDFEDLIIEASKILENKKLTHPFEVILVDEFQDTSPMQLEFIQALYPQKLFVVGDDWQSIYKFRRAEPSIMIDFPMIFSPSKRLFLTKNFRSQKKIVQLGNRLIKLSNEYVPKKLSAFYKAEKKPVCHIINKSSKKNNTSDIIKKLIAWNQKKYSEATFTILVRTNFERFQIDSYFGPHLGSNYKIMTIHASKGLEFDHVIIWGIEKNTIPHKWGDHSEEVRLLYVAVTRAKKSLQFVAFEDKNSESSKFLPYLTSKCKIHYL